MALIEGLTGMRLAELTMYSDGRIVTGMAMEGRDHHGVVIRKEAIKHHSTKHSEWRISFFHVGDAPVWWGSRHVAALKEWMARNEIMLRVAAHRSTRGGIFDVSDQRSKGSVPEIKS